MTLCLPPINYRLLRNVSTVAKNVHESSSHTGLQLIFFCKSLEIIEANSLIEIGFGKLKHI